VTCRRAPKPTDADRAVIAEIRANGGDLTLAEYVHTQAFQRVAMYWTGPRARAGIREAQAEGRWADAHAHPDGSIYVPRV